MRKSLWRLLHAFSLALFSRDFSASIVFSYFFCHAGEAFRVKSWAYWSQWQNSAGARISPTELEPKPTEVNDKTAITSGDFGASTFLYSVCITLAPWDSNPDWGSFVLYKHVVKRQSLPWRAYNLTSNNRPRMGKILIQYVPERLEMETSC